MMSTKNTHPETVKANVKASRRRLAWIAGTAAVVLIAGGTATAVISANYSAETQALCASAAAAAKKQSKAHAAVDANAMKVVVNSTDAAVTKVVPGATAYSAVVEVKADPANKITARPSARTLIDTATSAQKAAQAAAKPLSKPTCTDREQASTLRTATAKTIAADKKLADSVSALDKDVAAFKTAEQARIAAAQKAAEEAAAQAAAAAAAQAEADRVAAEQAAWEQNNSSRDGSYSGGSGGGSYSGGGGGGSSSGGSGGGGSSDSGEITFQRVGPLDGGGGCYLGPTANCGR